MSLCLESKISPELLPCSLVMTQLPALAVCAPVSFSLDFGMYIELQRKRVAELSWHAATHGSGTANDHFPAIGYRMGSTEWESIAVDAAPCLYQAAAHHEFFKCFRRAHHSPGHLPPRRLNVKGPVERLRTPHTLETA